MRRRLPGWLRRRWPLLLLLPVAALSMAWITASPPTYAASALMRVPAGEEAGTPGQPIEASYLAETYARLIPADEELASRVAELSAIPEDEIAGSISALQLPGSSLVEVTATGTDATTVQRTIEAMVQVLGSSSAVSSAIPPRVLVPVSSTSIAQTSLDQWQTLLGAGAAGLLLAVLLVIIFERIDPRIDSRDDAAEVTTCPTSMLDEDEIMPLVRAWDAVSAHVELVPLTPRERPVADQLRQLIDRATVARSVDLAVSVGDVPGTSRAPSTALGVGLLRTGSQRSVLHTALRDLSMYGSTGRSWEKRDGGEPTRAGWASAADDRELDLLLLCPRRLRDVVPATPPAVAASKSDESPVTAPTAS